MLKNCTIIYSICRISHFNGCLSYHQQGRKGRRRRWQRWQELSALLHSHKESVTVASARGDSWTLESHTPHSSLSGKLTDGERREGERREGERYSGTSDKGQPLYKGHLFQPHANTLVHYLTSEIVTTSLQGTKLLVSLVRRFHCKHSKQPQAIKAIVLCYETL